MEVGLACSIVGSLELLVVFYLFYEEVLLGTLLLAGPCVLLELNYVSFDCLSVLVEEIGWV